MAKKFLTSIDLVQNELNNVRVQNLASNPSSPVAGQVYFNTGTKKFRVYNGITWDEMGTSEASGDMSVAVYDPQLIQDDAFARSNHTGTQAIATVTGLSSALDGKASTSHSHTASQITDLSSAVSSNTDVAANTSARHAHSNKAVLDATTASFTTGKDTKLSGIATGATANDTDVNLKNRANHTGAQAISTVTGLQSALNDKSEIEHTHLSEDITDFVTAVEAIADASAAAIVDGSPEALDTLNELAAALGDDPNFATTVSTNIGNISGRVDIIEADGGPTKKYATTVGGSVSIVVTHNLGSADVITQVREVSSNAVVECDTVNSTSNTVTLGFDSAPAASSLRVTVIG